MKQVRKILSTILIIALIALSLGSVISASAAEFITDSAKTNGSNYTNTKELAAALNKIFAGDIDLFKNFACTEDEEAEMKLGSRIPNSTQYYVKSKTTQNVISGWQCYIYANAVYNQLFGEWVGHAKGFAHSRTVIGGGAAKLSFDMLSSAGVRCGAYIRTTGNKDGSYNSNIGHSMIVLSYDKNGITYLEGNADGKGLVRIATRTWEDFNSTLLTVKNRYIAHIVQPKDEIYEELYHLCDHDQYGDTGKCLQCGEEFDWKSTFTLDAFGSYQVMKAVAPSLGAPYEALASKNLIFGVDERLAVTGSYKNAAGQQWYVCTDGKGAVYYLPAQSVKYVEPLPLEVVSRDFSPADHALLERKAQPVKGQVTSSYPIKRIVAYLNGKQYAEWIAQDRSTYSVELRNTDINKLLTFSVLEKGRHTITLKMESYLLEETLTVHESAFFMEAYTNCTHNYQSKVTVAASCTQEGVKTETCTICGDQKNGPIPALGHQYQDDVCIRCGKTDLLKITGKVTSQFGDNLPTEVTLRKDSILLAQETVSGLSGAYSFQKLKPGSYMVEFHKDGGVPRRIELELSADTQLPDAAIYRLGDVSGDNNINIGDVALLYAHVQNTDLVIELYKLQCGDMSADGKINIGDVARIYALIRGKNKN